MTSFATLSITAQLQTSDENWESLIAALSEHTEPRNLYGPNSNGANIFLWYESILSSFFMVKVDHLKFLFSLFPAQKMVPNLQYMRLLLDNIQTSLTSLTQMKSSPIKTPMETTYSFFMVLTVRCLKVFEIFCTQEKPA